MADAPGTKGTGATLRDGDRKLDESGPAAFRRSLGSVMYVALDRLEILYATKTVAAFLQSPKSAMAKLKREVRHPPGFTPGRMCRSTWMCTGAEFYACKHGTVGGPQTCHFLTEARMRSDSSARRGIVSTQGTGRLRHLEIRHMWTGAAWE